MESRACVWEHSSVLSCNCLTKKVVVLIFDVDVWVREYPRVINSLYLRKAEARPDEQADNLSEVYSEMMYFLRSQVFCATI